MSDYVQIEANTVYLGTLLEDMIDTVSRTKAMYCDVSIPDLFVEGYSHPLTYVPFYAMTLPLKKGDKVLIRFKDEDYSLPYIWKNPSEIDSAFYEKFSFPTGVSGGNITIPDSVDTVSSIKIGENSFIIKTDNYTLIRQNNGYILIDTDNKIYVQGSEINIISNGDCKLDVSGNCNIYSSSTCSITANAGFTVNNHLKVNP